LLGNLESAVTEGNKVEVTAPMTGPSGVKANVLSIWEVVEEAGKKTYRLITAQPGARD
jgi:hypothetical protein